MCSPWVVVTQMSREFPPSAKPKVHNWTLSWELLNPPMNLYRIHFNITPDYNCPQVVSSLQVVQLKLCVHLSSPSHHHPWHYYLNIPSTNYGAVSFVVLIPNLKIIMHWDVMCSLVQGTKVGETCILNYSYIQKNVIIRSQKASQICEPENKKKVKLSCNRLWRPIRLWDVKRGENLYK
jgi:hypothetical protein